MSADEVRELFLPLLQVMEKLHQMNITHRDISPDNIICVPNGTLKLIDFGSARQIENGKSVTVNLKAGFSPAEQYTSQGQGPWTDVYSMTATIYYCLTGMAPPCSPDRALEDELMIPSRLGIEISAQQEEALLKGMEFRPRLRTRTIEGLYAALYKEVPPPPPPPPPPIPDPVLKPWAKIAIVAVAALVIGFTVFWASPRNNEEGTAENPQDVPTMQESAEENSLDELLKLQEDAFLCADGNAQTLRRVMSNMETKALRLSGTTDIRDSSLTITKPVFVDTDAEFWVNNEVTVDGTTLYIEGSVAPECILRTVNGGRIVVADGGNQDNVGLLWLESRDDLVVLDGMATNHGFLGLHCVGMQVNGIIDNYGELVGIMSEPEMRDGQPYVEAINVNGSINNFGFMRGNFRVQNGGRLSGNEVENNNA